MPEQTPRPAEGPDREALIHDLKVIPPYFDDLLDGSKTFEVRKDDRDFQVGDVLRLREYDGQRYTSRETDRRVTYVLRGLAAHQFGVARDHCVLALLPTPPAPGVEDGLRAEVEHAAMAIMAVEHVGKADLRKHPLEWHWLNRFDDDDRDEYREMARAAHAARSDADRDALARVEELADSLAHLDPRASKLIRAALAPAATEPPEPHQETP